MFRASDQRSDRVPGGEGLDNDLTDFVDLPREGLDVEIKAWVDFGDPIARAKTARHLAALANHGGGYLVFGFQDDLTRAPERPADLSAFNRDIFAAIVKKYLEPVFQCDVQHVAASDGVVFPVVRVPSHGSAPVVAKADGPHDAKGRPQGIRAGDHYIRRIGPESAAAAGPSDWQPLIRRCVLHDRTSLMGEISGVLSAKPEPVAPRPVERLGAWHEQSEQRFNALIGQAPHLSWPVDLQKNHSQLSYLIAGSDQTFDASSLPQVLTEVNLQVRDTVWTGWSMFYPFTRADIRPTIHAEFPDGTGGEVLETNLVADGNLGVSLPDMWRVTTDGRASMFRAYREDRAEVATTMGRPAGSWMSPETIVREIAELVAHARATAERVPGATNIAFRCKWVGLAGRELKDFGAAYWSPGQIARADQRVIAADWVLPVLASKWEEAVASLACPVLNLFGFDNCGPDFVRGLAPRFKKL